MGFLYSYLTRVPCASPLRSVLKKKKSAVCFTSTGERPGIHQRLARALRTLPKGADRESTLSAQRGEEESTATLCLGLSYDYLRKWFFTQTAISKRHDSQQTPSSKYTVIVSHILSVGFHCSSSFKSRKMRLLSHQTLVTVSWRYNFLVSSLGNVVHCSFSV